MKSLFEEPEKIIKPKPEKEDIEKYVNDAYKRLEEMMLNSKLAEKLKK